MVIYKIFVTAIILILFPLTNITNVFAISETGQCDPLDFQPNHGCDTGLLCKSFTADPNRGSCEKPITETGQCSPNDLLPNHGCDTGLLCKSFTADPNRGSCEKPAGSAQNRIPDIFGKISPPSALQNLLKNDPTGAGAISKFLSNGVTLIYSIAAIILLFMFLWGAFQWLTSGGDKEQLAAAQKRIINAIIGIILFAVAFAVIQVLGQFTGFTFFAGQK
ncbi:hypothetical protein HYU95_03635 [Candidatus Daviesbacteria bacterium]|nr:hypothetical protein [Candidatus Daviesbacteria bacterium]